MKQLLVLLLVLTGCSTHPYRQGCNDGRLILAEECNKADSYSQCRDNINQQCDNLEKAMQK